MSDSCDFCTVISAKYPTGLLICLCVIAKYGGVSMFSAVLHFTAADKISGEKTESGPSRLANPELHPPKWIRYLQRPARHKDHVCCSRKSVGAALPRIWANAFCVVGDVCFASPGVCFASFLPFTCCHKAYWATVAQKEHVVTLSCVWEYQNRRGNHKSEQGEEKKVCYRYFKCIHWGCQSAHKVSYLKLILTTLWVSS